MERLQQIKDKLTCMGIYYDSLKPFIKEYLNRIEDIVEKQEEAQYEALETLKNNNLTSVSVAKELNCSRTTLYNHNQLLKRYIEYSSECIVAKNPLAEIAIHAYKRKLLEEQVALMEIRDIENERLQHDYKMLAALLKSKNAEVGRLQGRIVELTAELRKYKISKR